MIVDVLIIGAGVYGISLANCLVRSNHSFAICGDFMDMWQRHTFDNMKLRSDFKLSQIYDPVNKYSVENFLTENPEYSKYQHCHLPVLVFRKYLNWVEKNLPYPVIKSKVHTLEYLQKTTLFRAKLENNKEIFCKKVVIATGLSDYKYIPPEILSYNNKVFHSYETDKISKIKNKKVLVIGTGQSAAECLEILLKNNNRVTNCQRKKPVFLEQPVNIPRWLFHLIDKSGTFFFHIPNFYRGILNKILSTPTVMPEYKNIFNSIRAQKNLENLSEYDLIISASGFRFNLNNLPFLSSQIKNQLIRIPISKLVNKNFESPVEGLFFTGPIASLVFGPSMKFIIGARYASEKIYKYLDRS